MKQHKFLLISMILCLLPAMFFVSVTSASAGWTQIYRGGVYDELIPLSVIQTSDGGYAMAVFADAKHIDNIGYAGHFTSQYELYLIKTDSSGNMQWNQTFTKSSDPSSELYSFWPGDVSWALIQTTDGYVLGGTDANHNLCLIKTDSAGRFLWMKKYLQNEAGYSFSLMHSMIQTSDGGFLFAGSTETSNGAEDFLVVKADSQGNEKWSEVYNSGTYQDGSGNAVPRHDEATGVVQTSDGGYAIVGQTTTYVSLSGTYDTFLVKAGSSGAMEWTKIISGPNAAGAEYRVVQASDGGFVLATAQVVDSDDTAFVLVKTDSSGNERWRKIFGDDYYDAPCALIKLSNGYAIGGTITYVEDDYPISRDLGLVRVDLSGNQQWVKLFNAKIDPETDIQSEEYAYSMILTRDGSYVVVGSTVNGWDGSHGDVFFVKTESLEQPPAESSPIVVSDVSGSVELQTPEQQTDSWTQVNDGDNITEGTRIRTQQSSGEITLTGVTIIDIQPNTLIDVESLTGDGTTLLLNEGEFTASVTGLPSGSTLQIDMSQAVAVITGTIFTVTETGTQSTLSVAEGSVVFTSKVNGETVTVTSGQTVVATSEGLNSHGDQTSTSDNWVYIVVVVIVAVVALAGVAFFVLKKRKP
ncbi:MAG: FecR family protein [Candidatus Bathyarchaeia archaeon]|jgi:hypothetical protein